MVIDPTWFAQVLLHSVWQVAVIAAGATVAAWLVGPRAARRYGVWFTALLLCLAAPVATAWHALPASPSPVAPVAPPPLALQAPVATAPAPAGAPPAMPAPPAAAWQPWLEHAAVIAWATGVLLMALWHAGGWWRLRRLVRRALPLPAVLAPLAQRCLAAAGVQARVLLSAVAVPCVVGVVRPVVLLPLGLAAQLPAAQVEAQLLHELAHLRRRDWIGTWLATTVETLLFFHPCAWWLSRRLRSEREPAADARAVATGADRVELAAALLALIDRPAPRAALAASGGVLADRVRLLLDAPVRRRPQGRLVALVVVSVALAGLLAACGGRRAAPESGVVERVPGSLVWPAWPVPDRAQRVGAVADLSQLHFEVCVLDLSAAALARHGLDGQHLRPLDASAVQRLLAEAEDEAEVRLLEYPTIVMYPWQRTNAQFCTQYAYVGDYAPKAGGWDPEIRVVNAGLTIEMMAAPDGPDAVRLLACDLCSVQLLGIEVWNSPPVPIEHDGKALGPAYYPVEIPVLEYRAASLRDVRIDAARATWVLPFDQWIERGHTRVQAPRSRLAEGSRPVAVDAAAARRGTDGRTLLGVIRARYESAGPCPRLSGEAADVVRLARPVTVRERMTLGELLAAITAEAGVPMVPTDIAAVSAELTQLVRLTPGRRPVVEILREALPQTLLMAEVTAQGLHLLSMEPGQFFLGTALGWGSPRSGS